MTAIEPHRSQVERLSDGFDREAILRHLNLNPREPATQALLVVCERYGLDPVLKHMVLISGRPYVTRDGYLHIAHASGQFDGLEVVDAGEDNSHWWAKVSVWRKDMGRPFTFLGRYPKADAKHMARYGPEMAIKTAEVMALRRAFDVSGIGAADEQWDTATPTVPVASAEQIDAISAAIGGLDDQDRTGVKDWWKERGFPPLTSGRLSIADADEITALLADLEVTVAELVDEGTDAEAAELAGDPFAGLPDETGAPQAAGGFYPEDLPQVDTGEAMTDAQSKALHALMRSVYNATGPARFPILTDLLGREITTTKDVTKAEASRLIDEMQAVGEEVTS